MADQTVNPTSTQPTQNKSSSDVRPDTRSDRCSDKNGVGRKVKPMTKQDRQHILSVLDPILTPGLSESKANSIKTNWVDAIDTLDSETLYRSIAQILNSDFDGLPQSLIDSIPKLANVPKNKITVLDVLSCSNTVFRFAPAPSGHLHIGHFVPLLLNVLLRSVTRHNKNKSDIVFRIDDTNPNEDDYSSDIKVTMKRILGDSFDNFIETRSSVLAPKVIALIDASIMGDDDTFYVDLSSQETISKERTAKVNSAYRDLSKDERIKLWDSMKSGELKNAVVRAKIDMQSDNGNLRDPVMLRYVRKTGTDDYILMPTYDLVCPVLDSFDGATDGTILIALRDCNYYDRLDQYYWIQNALHLKPTAVLTFSRVNFENILLSKRKIKKLIETGVVSSWGDPRLMTIDGVFNRGMTLSGLLNFYWLTGHASVGNRSTSQDVDSLFALNDKVLSQRSNFIVDRMPIDFSPTDSSPTDSGLTDPSSTYKLLTVSACVQKKGLTKDVPNVNVRNKTQFLSHSTQSKSGGHGSTVDSAKDKKNTDDVDTVDAIDVGDVDVSDQDLVKLPDLVHVKDIFIKSDRLITCNLRNIMDLSNDNSLSQTDLDNGTDLISRFNLQKDKFKRCSDIVIGDVVKINNFKDAPSEPVFAGYYRVMNMGRKVVNGVEYDTVNVLFIN
ncbi:glutamate-tRNA ligase [Yasminevirus sp. GU-2018]|uniref:Glutamate-tRNA ligase n=1 Tax=Yasminevirus sp. GU-2018 TaxID=2420051 RepID=A0A5K0UBH5_9VIRU|nr:glutamate-tRNA ligase [Yasminevirus sp. GU-2018]